MVSKIVNDSALKISYVVDIAEDGNDIVKYQRFNNIDITATTENIYAVASSIGTLLAKPVKAITLEEDSMLVQE